MELYQILMLLLASIMIAQVLSKFKRKTRTIREVLTQLFFWGLLLSISLFPDFFVVNIEKFTGLKSGITGILGFIILILGMLVLHLLQENEKRIEEITKIVRHLAMKDFFKKK